MTAEDILLKNPRYLTLSKSFDTFFSFGSLLITPNEFKNVMDLKTATIIIGKIHGENIVSKMIFPLNFLVSFHSHVMAFMPGDIISTGTP
jgi:2-keto-4-pentenoate hydratase/2-oxohepta-3-ene-1,7-dioic acid hydratase in catechol pathway